MAHSETMAALALITDELKSLRNDVKALQEGAIVGGLHSTRTRAGLSGADQGAIAADEQPSADRTDINDGGCVTAGTSRAAADDEPSYSLRPSLPSINSRALSRARLHEAVQARTNFGDGRRKRRTRTRERSLESIESST